MIHLYPVGELFVPRKRPGRPVFHEAVLVYAHAAKPGEIERESRPASIWKLDSKSIGVPVRFHRTKQAAICAARKESK